MGAMRRLLFETVILPRIFFSSKFPTEHKLRKPNPNPDTAIAPPKKFADFPFHKQSLPQPSKNSTLKNCVFTQKFKVRA